MNKETTFKLNKNKMDLPDVRVTIFLSRFLKYSEENLIEKEILKWYSIGVSEGYNDGYLHSLNELIFDDEATIYLDLDMGSCKLELLEQLLQKIKETLSKYKVKITKIDIE